MERSERRQANQDTFRRLKEFIRQTYPPGRVVAIADGGIVAEADRFEVLRIRLVELGYNPRETLVVEGGRDYPDYLVMMPLLHIKTASA